MKLEWRGNSAGEMWLLSDGTTVGFINHRRNQFQYTNRDDMDTGIYSTPLPEGLTTEELHKYLETLWLMS